MEQDDACTAFLGLEIVAEGPLAQVAPVALAKGVLVFDDRTGRVVDLDPRDWVAPPPPRRGRPKLGVVAREVTLLKRHWDWLGSQPGGASATIRRLVEAARAAEGGAAERRDACWRAMNALAGDLPGFEEASRALYAGDLAGFAARVEDWPEGIRGYVRRMAGVGA